MIQKYNLTDIKPLLASRCLLFALVFKTVQHIPTFLLSLIDWIFTNILFFWNVDLIWYGVVPPIEFTIQRWERQYPRELWLKIFTYLSRDDLCAVAVVCKTFYQVANDPSIPLVKEMKETISEIIARTSERYWGSFLFSLLTQNFYKSISTLTLTSTF
jgi:hypothetical protein